MHIRKNLLILVTGVLMLQGAACAADTAYNLGVYAYRDMDYASARQHWHKAVEEGEPSAMNNLGFLLFNALGGPRDETRAVALWTAAAKAGNAESQWHLAYAFERGTGVKRDAMEAYAWYRCAIAGMPTVARDDEDRAMIADAKNALVRVLGQLPEDGVAEAERRARDYIGKFADTTGKRPSGSTGE